jgi:ketosteroid isomerase-like protein
MGVLACGGDDDASSTSGVPSGVMSALDGFSDAINAYDTEAFLAHTTEDFTWQSTGDVTSRPDFVIYFEAYYEEVGFHSELTGEQVIEPDGDAYVVTAPDHITAQNYDEEGESVIRVVGIDGTWLVQELRWHATTPETDG